MKGADGFVQGYNAEAAVEPELWLIVGQRITEAANDKQQLQPMVEAIEQQSGQRPEAILADSGYCSEENLAYLESSEEPANKIEGYIATGEVVTTYRPRIAPNRIDGLTSAIIARGGGQIQTLVYGIQRQDLRRRDIEQQFGLLGLPLSSI